MSNGPNVTLLELKNLKEETNYIVKVRAHNINGVGLSSYNFTTKTWLAGEFYLILN